MVYKHPKIIKLESKSKNLTLVKCSKRRYLKIIIKPLHGLVIIIEFKKDFSV